MMIFCLALLFSLSFGCTAAPLNPELIRKPAGDAVSEAPETPKRELLWKLVREECVAGPPYRAGAPCVWTHAPAGYLLMRDRKSATHHLLIPTITVTGIEDPQLLKADAPNYFQGAWRGAGEIGAALGREIPREWMALAINPMTNRSQDQFHIHIDCVRIDVEAKLKAMVSNFSETAWSDPVVELAGATYRARLLRGETLAAHNPFRLLSDSLSADGGRPMGEHTLVVIGAKMADGAAGFVLLDRSAAPGEGVVHGEDVQDFACDIARSEGK